MSSSLREELIDRGLLFPVTDIGASLNPEDDALSDPLYPIDLATVISTQIMNSGHRGILLGSS